MTPSSTRLRAIVLCAAWGAFVLPYSATAAPDSPAAEAAPATSQVAPTLQLVVEFTHLEPQRGEVVAAIYGDEESFSSGGKPVQFEYLPVQGETLEWKIQVAAGTYAVKAYQDFNTDHLIDLDPSGMPVEPYGYSNNVRHKLKRASWDEAKFEVESAHGISIQIQDH